MSPLTELMERRSVVLEELLMISKKQFDFVQQSDIGSLLQLLGRKQRFLDKLELVERELDPFRSIAPENRTWENTGDRDRCSAAMQRCDELLASIMRIDKQSEERLAVLKEETQRQLQKTETVGRAASAYAKQNVQPTPPVKTTTLRFDAKR